MKQDPDPATIRIFPSPAYERVRLEGLDEGTRAGIVDGHGRTVMRMRGSGKALDIPVSDIPNGWYIVSGQQQDGQTWRKRFHVVH